MKLQNCLLQQTWRTLRAIARVRKLPFDDHLSKQDSASQLAQHLVEPERWQATWHALSPEAQAALRALSEADGLMRQEVFTARFGPIRPYKPWRDDAPAAPWENPASPAEELAYRGLIFVLNQGSKRRPLWVVLLPDEVKAVLTFLCFLHREDLKPLHGRWLPPSACRTLAPRLSAINHPPSAISHPPSAISHPPSATIRSERQWPYLSFVHYLAERAGLVDREGEWLKPTVVAQAEDKILVSGWLGHGFKPVLRLILWC